MKTISINLVIAEQFSEACKECGVSEQKALALYIEHLNLYSILAEREEGCPFSMAADIFSRNTVAKEDKKNPNRFLHVLCVKELIRIIKSGESIEIKEKTYKTLIDYWYENL